MKTASPKAKKQINIFLSPLSAPSPFPSPRWGEGWGEGKCDLSFFDASQLCCGVIHLAQGLKHDGVIQKKCPWCALTTYRGNTYFMNLRKMIRGKGYSAFLFLPVVVRVNFIPCWTEAIGCVVVVKKVGAEINRFGFYFNKMIFAGIGSPAQTLIIA